MMTGPKGQKGPSSKRRRTSFMRGVVGAEEGAEGGVRVDNGGLRSIGITGRGVEPRLGGRVGKGSSTEWTDAAEREAGERQGGGSLEDKAAMAGGQGMEAADQAEEAALPGEEWEGETVGGTAGRGQARKGAGKMGMGSVTAAGIGEGGVNKRSRGAILGRKRPGNWAARATPRRRGLRLRPPQSTEQSLLVGV